MWRINNINTKNFQMGNKITGLAMYHFELQIICYNRKTLFKAHFNIDVTDVTDMAKYAHRQQAENERVMETSILYMGNVLQYYNIDTGHISY